MRLWLGVALPLVIAAILALASLLFAVAALVSTGDALRLVSALVSAAAFGASLLIIHDTCSCVSISCLASFSLAVLFCCMIVYDVATAEFGDIPYLLVLGGLAALVASLLCLRDAGRDWAGPAA